MKRTMVLVAMMMAVVMVLSAPMADAKKKHHKKKSPAFNVVQCPTSGETGCFGTPANDFLIGGPADREFGAFDLIPQRERPQGKNLQRSNHDEV
jgi:hypothetical protein